MTTLISKNNAGTSAYHNLSAWSNTIWSATYIMRIKLSSDIAIN